MYETHVLRDGGTEYFGRGVRKAIRNVNETIAPSLKGVDVRNQKEIDAHLIELDGTENKSKLGANAIVGVSLAVARTAANSLDVPLYAYVGGPAACVLPAPLLNYINGGKLAATDLDFQEHIIIPVGAKSFSEAMRKGVEVYYCLGQMLAKKYTKYVLNTADEGGYTPPNQIGTITEAVEAGRYAIDNGYAVMVSERSGEPEDDSIADIAVALNCGQIKTGAPARAEHTAKYNQLFRIEEQLGSNARYLGRRTLSTLH
jgi:enolase